MSNPATNAQPGTVARTKRARRRIYLGVTGSAVALAGLFAAAPASAETCAFAPAEQIHIDAGIEPQLMIDGTCSDPVYNERTFVIDKTEELTFQVPDGPTIPYTQVTGHFPATATLESLPPGVRQSPTTYEQAYVFKFPAKEFWQNRSFLNQHPSGGGAVDDQMAFTNGAYSIIWKSNSIPNAVATHRHQAAATKLSNAYARRLYGDDSKIYNYFWGCSGGGTVSIAAAENTVGVWDGVQPQCVGTSVDAQYHSFYWQALYTMGIPQAKRDAIAVAAAPGGTGDIYAGLNEEEKSVLDEFLAAGFPRAIIGNHFKMLTPLIDPIDIRLGDPTYEDDFWSKPGYAGSNPPDYLKAALVDGWATITEIERGEDGQPVAIRFDPATMPALGTTGDNYLEYWVYADDGETRLIDPKRNFGPPTENKNRFSLMGNLDYESGRLSLTGAIPQMMGPPLEIRNSPVLVEALEVGSKVRINNRFILAMYYYPRHSIVAGIRSHDQYRKADGSAIYPQRPDLSPLYHSTYRTMGGRPESGDITTKIMILEGMSDQLSWPIFNVGYAERVEGALGPEKAADMMRFYLHDNGSHSQGAGQPGVFQQSMQDMMAWVERGIAPPPSTRYTVVKGQVVAAKEAADRHGLQPVMQFTANGGSRAEVAPGEAVRLAGKLEMPPGTGTIVRYSWTIADADKAQVVTDRPDDTGNVERYGWSFGDTQEAVTVLEQPRTLVEVARELTFSEPGEYIVRLTVDGQRDGLLAPGNRTVMQNFQDIRVVVR